MEPDASSLLHTEDQQREHLKRFLPRHVSKKAAGPSTERSDMVSYLKYLHYMLVSCSSGPIFGSGAGRETHNYTPTLYIMVLILYIHPK